MANLDLEGFVTPEQSFKGLSNLSDKLQENKKIKQLEQQKSDANKASMIKFLTSYTDPKANLSGAPTDPVVVKGFADVTQGGIKLVNENKGMTTDMLITALYPAVSKLAIYASKAKDFKGQIDERIKNLDVGYDKSAILQKARQSAFYNEDGTLKENFTDIDTSKDWVAETVLNYPDLVTNDKAIDEWVKGNKMMVNSKDIIEWNNKGGKKSSKVETTAYDWAIPEVDEKTGVYSRGFVPKYDLAIDGDEEIMGEFDDGKGGKTKAQVRLLDNGIYTSILGSRTGAADWVRGQVMKAIKGGTYKDNQGNPLTLNSPQANNLGRMILYDELKKRGLGGMQNVAESKPTQIKVYAPRGGGGGRGDGLAQGDINRQNNLHKTLNDIIPDGNNRLDVSRLLNGINFVNKYNDKVIINDAKYDPIKKEFIIKTSKGDEVIPYHKLFTLAVTSNPGTDIKWMEGFETYKRAATKIKKGEFD